MRRRIAPDRDATPSRFVQASICLIIASGRRTPTNGSLPVAGRPRFLGLTFIDFRAIFGSYRNCEPMRNAERAGKAHTSAISRQDCLERARAGVSGVDVE